MRHARILFAGTLACLAIGSLQAAPITGSVQPTESAEAFQIMTPAEVEEHRAKMAELSGDAREQYRNEHYQMLRERALAQGYEMPETPPWGRTDVLPSPAAQAPADDDIAARREELQKEVEVRREALRKEVASRREAAEQAHAEAVAAAPQAPQPPATPESEEQPAAAAEPPQARTLPPQRAEREAEHEARRAEMAQAAEQRRQEMEKAVAQRKAEMEKRAEQRRAAVGAPPVSETGRGPAVSEEAREAYREAMRERFEQYMAEREAARGEPPQADDLDARREESQQLMEERRAEMQARIDQAIEAMGQRRSAPPARFRPTPYAYPPRGGYPYGPPPAYYGQPGVPPYPGYRWGPGY